MTINSTTLSANGKFHLFHLARGLERHGLLKEIWTGYPRFKLKDEAGVPPEKIRTFPWYQSSYMAALKLGLANLNNVEKDWAWLSNSAIDQHLSRNLSEPGVLVALSGTGLHSGLRMKSLGGRYICDRASTHILIQEQILQETYSRYGLCFRGIDPRIVEKELREYEKADVITVPSQVVYESFVKHGLDHKVRKIPYGANLQRFHPVNVEPIVDFEVLWVGAVSIRKDFLTALEAFHSVERMSKRFTVIGAIQPDMRHILKDKNLQGVEFLGRVNQEQLKLYYSRASVLLLTSVEEGLACVQGEAMACGCPVVSTYSTGAADLFSDGEEGFITRNGAVDDLGERLQLLADDSDLRRTLSTRSLQRVKHIAGWGMYGDTYASLVREIAAS